MTEVLGARSFDHPTHKRDYEGPISIKEILGELDGQFPMDEAVIEGEPIQMSNTHK